MKILHLEASPGWGGQEIRILREAEGMRSRGHEVILGVMRKGQLIEEAKKKGFEVYALNFNKIGWLGCLFQLLALMRRHKIDLVNTHSSLDSWIGGIAARLASRPIIRTRHLSTTIRPGLNSRLLYGKLADYVVTTCASILPMIVEQSGKRPEQCASIPTGVDPGSVFCPSDEAAAFRASIGVQPTDFLVGMACFMRSWKGIGDFLKAADLLRHEKKLKWVLIGGGHIETYQKLASDLGVSVHFTGHLANPFPAMGALDLFALLSTSHEGVSQAILQAAFLGKPLLATATGGLGEVCLDRITGLQVPPFSPEAVARSVVELKGNQALCKQFGLKARALVEEKFTLKGMLDQMEAVSLSLVK